MIEWNFSNQIKALFLDAGVFVTAFLHIHHKKTSVIDMFTRFKVRKMNNFKSFNEAEKLKLKMTQKKVYNLINEPQ